MFEQELGSKKQVVSMRPWGGLTSKTGGRGVTSVLCTDGAACG